jgi:hypothetical protein
MKQVLFFLVILAAVSCNKPALDSRGYMNYLADEKNGLVKENNVSGIKIKVKYLPEDYLVYTAVKNSDSVAKEKEKVRASYANSLTFMLTLGPDDKHEFSITKLGVSNYQEFAERIQTMSFEMKDYIRLTIKDKEYEPDMVQMESINSLEPHKSFVVVFRALDEQGKKIVTDDLLFSFDDELFNTGVSKFKFKINDIASVPALAY